VRQVTWQSVILRVRPLPLTPKYGMIPVFAWQGGQGRTGRAQAKPPSSRDRIFSPKTLARATPALQTTFAPW
jgi:hypothetical protein